MNTLAYIFFFTIGIGYAQGEETPKAIHVFVALCDNSNQGIVPVSKSLGNGQNPKTNLYWGALYGVKTHFKQSKDWSFVKTVASDNPKILERILFKHRTTETYLLADAYDGRFIAATTTDFLRASSGENRLKIMLNEKELCFGGDSDLVAYVGHDGLMDFELNLELKPVDDKKRDVIILACISKTFFTPYVKQTNANPLVWTTGLMSPEAYTLKWALDGWVLKETAAQIRERAAQAYHHYQKCGIRGARNLLVTGF